MKNKHVEIEGTGAPALGNLGLGRLFAVFPAEDHHNLPTLGLLGGARQ